MEINAISISSKTAPIEIRQLFAFSGDEQADFYKRALSDVKISQCVILSTCNRCEIYFDGAFNTVRAMEKLFCDFKNVSIQNAKKYINVFIGESAINHLLKVACGIDSVVLGEDEILRQIKDSYHCAHSLGAVGFEFNTIFKMAIMSAKKIKTLTGLSKTPVSVGTLTANEVFKFPKENKNVLIIGITGKIGTITAKNILSRQGITLNGTSRFHNAANSPVFTGLNVNIRPFSERYRLINSADIIISAPSSPHYTITKDEFLKNVRLKKPRLFIDLSVPPDIDSDINSVDMCRLFDIDYFKKLSEENNLIKRKEARSAESYIDGFKDNIIKELYYHDIVKSLPELNKAVNEKGLNRLFYSLRKLSDKEETEAVYRWIKLYLEEYKK